MEPTALAHVLQMARAADPTITENKARSVLGALGLAGGMAKDRRIGDLSGGEKVGPTRCRSPRHRSSCRSLVS